MKDPLETLTDAVPPAGPGVAIDWAQAEADLGVVLPRDYRALAETYGPGRFGGAVKLFVPGAQNLVYDLVEQTREHTDVNRSRLDARTDGRRFPYPLLPDDGGLVSWGESVNGEALMWATSGEPESWPVVAETYEDLATWEVPQPASAVLLGLLDGSLDIPFLMSIDPAERWTFVPARPPGIRQR